MKDKVIKMLVFLDIGIWSYVLGENFLRFYFYAVEGVFNYVFYLYGFLIFLSLYVIIYVMGLMRKEVGPSCGR